MTKLMIVDDEVFIRHGIKNAIPWYQYDIEVVGDASNGKEALRLAVQLRPDIVLADIQMPVMNGIELAKKLNELLPDTKVIILSAYGNTENFTSAIEAKVSRFVLKNADSSDILNNVLEVKKELEDISERSSAYDRVNSIYNENQYLIKCALLERFFLNKISPETFAAKADRLNINLSGPYYAIIVAECSLKKDWGTTAAFQNAFSECRPFAFFMDDTMLVMILNTDQNGIEKKKMDSVMSEIKPYVLGNRIALFNQMEQIQDFPASYHILNHVLDFCFWNTELPYAKITKNDIPPENSDANVVQLESKIVSAVLSKNNKAIDAAIDEYYSFCKNNLLSRTVFLNSVKRIIILISAVCPTEQDMEKIVQTIWDLETPDEIIDIVKSLVFPPAKTDAKNPQIIEALEYIDKNYSKDLKLEDVAKNVALSSGYLSRIFKSETGYSFTEWMNKVRIDKAKELIAQTDLKYYEIAEKVGYNDYKYFSSYFNKLCGCSAKEYKHRIKNQGKHQE